MKNYREIHHTHGLITTTLNLQFKINERYFVEGAMLTKCVAIISPVIWYGKSTRDSVLEWKAPPAVIDRRETMFLGRHKNKIVFFSSHFASCSHMKERFF